MEHHQFIFINISSPQWLVYSAVLLLAIFFRFSRVWSVRNLDLLLLLTLSGTIVVAATLDPRATPAAADAITQSVSSSTDPAEASNADNENSADDSTTAQTTDAAPPNLLAPSVDPVYRWVTVAGLIVSALLIVRLIFDESLTRRPRLEQNMNRAGLTFLLIPSFFILMTAVFLKDPPPRNFVPFQTGDALLNKTESSVETVAAADTPPPVETIIAATAQKMAELSGQTHQDEVPSIDSGAQNPNAWLAQLIILFSHTAVVLGLLYIGRRHFNSVQLGISMCCLYLILPCTAYYVHRVGHVVPAACMTWAVASYRKPAVAGVLLGLSCGTLFFAIFLLPLWAVFYGRKGSVRFGLSLAGVAAILFATLAWTSDTTSSFVSKLVVTANWSAFRLFDAATPLPEHAVGQMFLRFVLAILFFVMLVALTVLPRKRNLENLLASSTAVIVMAQLWYPDDIGSYILWYLPLFLLVMFRPRLDRFVPPVIDEQSAATRLPEGNVSSSGGGLSRVTLYS
ncbi:MAG: hypothetical protein ABJZ55_02155 [Fuerstiella sp.]